ncbi:hypothetical protein [Kitasatospora sp. NPDC050543]|uniref:hypothetical protein n=1 Tax=Kitasatospora sp. NPDC050543 TaxID=3364054 RepID=UPI0037AB5F08
MSWEQPAVLVVALAVLRLAGEVVRWLRARSRDEARAAMLVSVLRECGPNVVLTERSGDAALSVRSAETPNSAARTEVSGRG